MSLLKSLFGEKKTNKEKEKEQVKMAAMIEEIAAQSVVAEKWEVASNNVSAETVNTKSVINETIIEKDKIVQGEVMPLHILDIKPLPLMFNGVSQEVVAVISAAVAYSMEEESRMFVFASPAPPIGRKAGKWSSIGRQELMLVRQG